MSRSELYTKAMAKYLASRKAENITQKPNKVYVYEDSQFDKGLDQIQNAFPSTGRRVTKRGEIWWIDLGVPTGSEPGYRRPVVIISANEFNQSGIRTVVIAAITPNLRLASAPR